ncbi:MFS transporter [Labrys monachus]|uniref:Uncharacterized MFS-type transporter J3R73_002348 n=1 Tax=Labrys monachus TaxID=217067 RepID=A0ABU0FDF8_9HYPH|nr:MFS transporter [Labrys monachus]MDQ0392556.1 MFS family permease [Labrys monachus]
MTELDKPVIAAPASNPVTALVPLIAIVFFGFLAIGIPLPVIPVEVHDVLGFSPVTAGWAVGIQSLATVLTRQAAGRICDMSGPRTAVLAGLPLASLAGVFYLVAAAFADPLVHLAFLFVGRLVLGVAESLFLTGAMAWGIVRVGPAHTGKVMAWQGIAIYAAVGIGAPLGIEAMVRWQFAGAALSTVLLPLAGVLVALALPRPALLHHSAERVPFYRVVGLIWRHGLAMSLATAPFAALAAFVALYYASRGWTGAGYPVMGFGAGYIVMRLFFAGLPDRMGGARVAAMSLPLECVGQLVLFAAPGSFVAFLGAVLTGVGFSLVFPAMGVEAVRRVPAHSRGLAVGGFVAFFDVALGLTGPAAGLLASGFGYRAIFLGGALCSALALAMACAFALPARQKA